MSPLRADIHVLIVEDDEDARALLVGSLSREGFDVTEVGTAELGLDALRARHFELVLTDYHLPQQSGTWMVAQARDEGVLRNENVLLLTASERVEGADGLRTLRKPMGFRELLDEVERACANVEEQV